jgi:hypothetical protein
MATIDVRPLVLWIAERLERGIETTTAELEAIFFLELMRVGCPADAAAASASTCARLFVWRIMDSLKGRHDPAKRLGEVRRARTIAADIRRLQRLTHRAVVIRHARRIAKEIRELASRPGWEDMQQRAELFDQIQATEKIDNVAENLLQLAANFKTIAEIIAKPIKQGRPRVSRSFGLAVELLAQAYFADTGKPPRAGMYQVAGRAQGEFFELVKTKTSKLRSQRGGRNALAKAIIRVVDTSPRIPKLTP